MLISRAVHALAIGVCAADGLARSIQPSGFDEPRTGPSGSSRDPVGLSGDGVAVDQRRNKIAPDAGDGRAHLPKDGALMRRRRRRQEKRRNPTVFSTTTIFTSITTTEQPTTSTVTVTVTDALTRADSAQAISTETVTITSSLTPQERRVPRACGSDTCPSRHAPMTTSLPPAAVSALGNLSGEEPALWGRERRRDQLSTVTSVITIISRKLVTEEAPTILVTDTAQLSPPGTTVGTATVVTSTVLIGPDGSPTSTPPSPPTSTSNVSPTSPPLPPPTSTVSPGPPAEPLTLSTAASAGLTGGAVLGALLFVLLVTLCLRRRRRRMTWTRPRRPKGLLSPSSLLIPGAAEAGTAEQRDEPLGAGAVTRPPPPAVSSPPSSSSSGQRRTARGPVDGPEMAERGRGGPTPDAIRQLRAQLAVAEGGSGEPATPPRSRHLSALPAPLDLDRRPREAAAGLRDDSSSIYDPDGAAGGFSPGGSPPRPPSDRPSTGDASTLGELPVFPNRWGRIWPRWPGLAARGAGGDRPEQQLGPPGLSAAAGGQASDGAGELWIPEFPEPARGPPQTTRRSDVEQEEEEEEDTALRIPGFPTPGGRGRGRPG